MVSWRLTSLKLDASQTGCGSSGQSGSRPGFADDRRSRDLAAAPSDNGSYVNNDRFGTIVTIVRPTTHPRFRVKTASEAHGYTAPMTRTSHPTKDVLRTVPEQGTGGILQNHVRVWQRKDGIREGNLVALAPRHAGTRCEQDYRQDQDSRAWGHLHSGSPPRPTPRLHSGRVSPHGSMPAGPARTSRTAAGGGRRVGVVLRPSGRRRPRISHGGVCRRLALSSPPAPRPGRRA